MEDPIAIVDEDVKERTEPVRGKSLRVRTLSSLQSFTSAPSPPNCPTPTNGATAATTTITATAPRANSIGANGRNNSYRNNGDQGESKHEYDGRAGNNGKPEQSLGHLSPLYTDAVVADNGQQSAATASALDMNSSKRISARNLQERIQSERNRVVSKRERLHQLRIETIDDAMVNEMEVQEDQDLLQSNVVAIYDSEPPPADGLYSIPTTIAFQQRPPSQVLDNGTQEPRFVDPLDVSDPELIRTLPSSHSPPSTPQNTRTKAKQPVTTTTTTSTSTRETKPKKPMSTRTKRAIKWCGVISALVAIVVTLVVVDRHTKASLAASADTSNNSTTTSTTTGNGGNEGTSNGTSNAGIPCDQVTNIFADCFCQDQLSTPLSDDVAYNRELVLELLIEEGALNDTSTQNMTSQSCHPHNQALLWVSDLENHVNGSMPTNLQLLQRYVLAVVYQQLGGSQWKSKNSWLDSKTSECEWEGIVCNSVTNRIMELNLNGNNLKGNLPEQELGTLDGLRRVNMGNNPSLTGALTSELTMLPLLQAVDLSSTGISGSLPTDFGSFLTELHLSSTVLKDALPTELGLIARLRDLDLSFNRFTGTFPTELLSLTDLETLDLSSNLLTGSLPTAAWESTALDVFNLHDNTAITGPYPNPPSLLLTMVNFANTALTGLVPGEYCDLVYLESIVVDCNGRNNASIASCPCCRCNV